MLTIRAAQWPGDAEALARLDTGFITEAVYRLVRTEWSLQLVYERLESPLRKRYEFDPMDATERLSWDHTAIAEEEGRLAGFAAAQYMSWNRRVVIWHLYVAPPYRGKGVGKRMLHDVETYARSTDARCLWLETQTINSPAIGFYRRCGFEFCGFDSSLYDPQSVSDEETALFFSYDLLRPRR